MTIGRIAAVTGGTGFLGRWIVRALAEAGWRPRLLVRHDPIHPQFVGLDYEIVQGDLDDSQALTRLVHQAGAIVHAAGAIKALSRHTFFTVNAEATARLARVAAIAAPDARFVMVSSLAAREPALSDYAASKAAGERAVRDHGPPDWVVMRPAAVYGPWDRETLMIFQAAARGLMPLPGGSRARICLIHAADAAAAIAAHCRLDAPGGTYEISDARSDGYDWSAISAEAARAVAATARVVRVPSFVLHIVGTLAGAAATITRKPTILTRGKVREMLHPDWSSARERQPAPDVWQPMVDLRSGFAGTADWYQRHAWL